jgi:hypothetical protein
MTAGQGAGAIACSAVRGMTVAGGDADDYLAAARQRRYCSPGMASMRWRNPAAGPLESADTCG